MAGTPSPRPGFWLAALGTLMVIAGITTAILGKDSAATVALIVMGGGITVISALLPRLSGQLELGPSGLKTQLTDLQITVESAEKKLPPGPIMPELEAPGQTESAIERYRYLRISASTNPEATLVQLANAVEVEVRNLLAQTGWLAMDPQLSFPATVQFAEERQYFPRSLTSSLRSFYEIRSSIVHASRQIPPHEIIRAIDLGMSILRMVDGIPHEIHTVYHPGVRVFEDAEGIRERLGVVALILNSTSPGGTLNERRVFPTRRHDYQVGQRVSWEWNMNNGWQESWYEDPDDHSIKHAWGASAEFVGRPLL